MQGRLRVLVLADAGSFHTERYIAELRRQGCHVLLISLEPGRITYHRLRQRGPIRSLWYILASTEVRRVIQRFLPDVINPHFVSGYGFTAALAQAKRFAPVITHAWGSDILVVPQKSVFHKRKTAYALSEASVLIGDSDYLIEQAESMTACNKSLVIPWGIERKYLSLHKADYRVQRPLRIIVPRQHEKIYNNPFVVRALAPLIEAGTVQLTFPNFGSQLGEFKIEVSRFPEGAINLYDRLEREDFLKLMAQHDVYISAASTDSSPVSLIESMAMGLIPVAPEIPGVKEWLGFGHGFVYSLYDAVQLRSVVSGIIDDDHDHRQIREANLKRIKKEAVFEDNIGRLVATMRDLAGKKG